MGIECHRLKLQWPKWADESEPTLYRLERSQLERDTELTAAKVPVGCQAHEWLVWVGGKSSPVSF